jgi:FlaA1/EpsC-like NDP-sugar epimerase
MAPARPARACPPSSVDHPRVRSAGVHRRQQACTAAGQRHQGHPPEQLPELIKDRNIDRILLALPSLTRRRRREILSQLEPLGVHVQTVPEFEQLVTGNANVGDIREVDVCDLLGRDSVPPKAGCSMPASATGWSW